MPGISQKKSPSCLLYRNNSGMEFLTELSVSYSRTYTTMNFAYARIQSFRKRLESHLGERRRESSSVESNNMGRGYGRECPLAIRMELSIDSIVYI